MSCSVVIGDDVFQKSENGEKKIPNEDTDKTVGVKQRLYRTSSFRKDYLQDEPEPQTCTQKLGNMCAGTNKKKMFAKLLPLLRIYRKYKIKTDLPNDVIAGFTVGIMQLPQGIILE